MYIKFKNAADSVDKGASKHAEAYLMIYYLSFAQQQAVSYSCLISETPTA